MQPSISTLSLQECQQYLTPRPREANKGHFGHVLVIGGDFGMEGAVRLAGEAALRSGAGLVTIATHPDHAVAISAACPELMCRGVETEADLIALLEKATVTVIGPGLGRMKWGKALLAHVLQTSLPLVVDADALNQLAESQQQHSRDNWILTPHPGEAARLLKQSVSEVQKDRVLAILALQTQYNGVIVLKGAGTLVVGSDKVPALCTAGNPGMATAGMGDVLSGIIAALVAQGLSLEEAARLGVCAHATAGDLAANVSGERGLMARDLLEGIRQCLNP